MGRIYLRNELDEDPRVIAIAAALGAPILHVVGMLWKLWSYADRHSRAGTLPHMCHASLDQVVEMSGFAVTLEKMGWLSVNGDSLRIPRYAEHCGQSEKRRRLDRLRQQRLRARLRNPSRVTSALRPRDVRVMSRGNTQSSSASASASATTSKEEASPPEKGRRKKLTDAEFLATLQANPAYAQIDLTTELARMDAWLLVHTERQKTRRFIVAWLNRAEHQRPVNKPDLEAAVPLEGDWPSVRALVEAYNTQTPDECPTVEELSPGRIAKIQRYLATFPERQFWNQVFVEIVQSPYLRGLKARRGEDPFVADLDWLLSVGRDGTENCVKVHDGKYRR